VGTVIIVVGVAIVVAVVVAVIARFDPDWSSSRDR
jgi:hypothetical protein